jgi:hypothetical protein
LAASTLSAWPTPNWGSVNFAPLTLTVPPLFHPALVRSSAEKELPPSALSSLRLLFGLIDTLLKHAVNEVQVALGSALE